jgi:hypothetical protein
MKKKPKPKACRCDGWWFPHRRGSMPAEGGRFFGKAGCAPALKPVAAVA